MTAPFRPARPWSVSDLRLAGALAAVAVGLTVWAWAAASGSADVNEQVGALAASVVGAVSFVVAAATWVLAGRNAVSALRLDVLGRIQTELPLVAATAEAVPADARTLVGIPGSPRYHRDDCLLVRGKRAERFASPAQAAVARRPCEMCRP